MFIENGKMIVLKENNIFGKKNNSLQDVIIYKKGEGGVFLTEYLPSN